MIKSIYLTLLFLIMGLNLPMMAQSSGVGSLRQASESFVRVSETVKPAVVYIQIEKNTRQSNGYGMTDDELLRYFFGMPR